MGQDADRDLAATNHVGLVVGLLLGAPIMLIGVVGLLRHTAATPPSSFLKFFVGGDLVHDFVVAPLALVIGLVVVRRVPQIARAPLRAALFGSAVVVAIAWPGIRRYGRMRAPDNATVQPLNYATATLTAVAVVVGIAAVWFAVALLRSRAHARTPRAAHNSDAESFT